MVPFSSKIETPKLTQAEYDLLKAHHGCFCCCLFYVGHVSPNCTLRPDEHPTLEAVKNCMLTNALKAKAAFEKRQMPTIVAAMFEADSEDDDISMGDDEAKEYVHHNISLPDHLWWTGCIDVPATCTPTPVRVLIDHGSPPVLISSDFVDIMCLPCHKLFKPFLILGALLERDLNLDLSTVLNEYCKLHLQLQDTSWKSHIINAIICPNLHTDLNVKYKASFKDRFPSDIPHAKDLPKDVYHHIEIKPGMPISVGWAYSCPRKYRNGWKTLIQQHLAVGRICPSSSPYTSPSFIIPKADVTVLLRWVNKYWKLNSVTVPDYYPLPRINNILADCSKGKVWGKIDMANSFFQTLVHPDHVKYTTTLTPFGLWKWVVMLMGLRNSPMTHQ
jgi:hypothetical protein